MKNKMFILNILLMTVTVVGGVFYLLYGTLPLKGTVAFTFVLTGAVNLIYCINNGVKPLGFPILAVLGLVFSMLGDIVLNISFIPGAALFAVGHVFYFASYTRLRAFSLKDAVPWLVIFVPSALFITVVPIFDFGSALMLGVCLCYAVIISLMVGKALSNLIAEKNVLNLTIVIGSVLFFFSDLMLVLRIFADAPRVFDWLCLMTYFPAQSILAHSVYRYAQRKNK